MGGPRTPGRPRSWYEVMDDWHDGLDAARRERERTGDPGHPPQDVAWSEHAGDNEGLVVQ